MYQTIRQHSKKLIIQKKKKYCQIGLIILFERSVLVDSQHLRLPNGIATTSDGSVFVANGGKDQVCKFTQDGILDMKIGGLGTGRYKLKEPVGTFASPDDKIFVADWYNHRVVIYDSGLNYISEHGHYGTVGASSIFKKSKSILKFHHYFSRGGSYFRHWNPDIRDRDRDSLNLSERGILFLTGMYYWYVKRNKSVIDSILDLHKSQDVFNKPNGVAFMNNKIYITQKNNCCISVYSHEEDSLYFLKNIQHPDDRFGRLGDIHGTSYGGCLYVCDPQNGIWTLNPESKKCKLQLSAESLDIANFFPFSCTEFSDNLLAVCAINYFYIIDIYEERILFQEETSQCHGVTICPSGDKLYVCERGCDRILQITI